MALTAASTVYPRGIASFGNWDVLTATAIYKGALIGLVVGTGTVTNYNDAAGHLLIGIADNTCTAAQATAGFKLQVRTITSAVFSATVTGATAATDNGKEIYATDESVYTMTRPADDALPVGIILYWVTSTTCHVLVFGVTESAVLALAGGSKRTIHLGAWSTEALAPVAATNILTGRTLWGHGLITKFYAIASGFDTSYLTGLQVLNLEIEGTNVTGGALSLEFTGIDTQADMALIKSATAITAANEFHDGDLLDIELATDGVAFTVAAAALETVLYNLYIDVEYRAGV